MDINKKIEEIRQKPEHIRLRYVWGLVAVSMLFIITIWVFSLKESASKLRSDNNQDNLPDISQSLEEIGSIKDSAPSINDIVKNAGNAQPTGDALSQEQNDLQAPSSNN